MIKAQTLHANSRVNIGSEGKRHLGAVTGSTDYRDECNLPFCQLFQRHNYNQFIHYSQLQKKTPSVMIRKDY